MRVAVLGASGQTGRELTRQALERGHDVTALVRDPARLSDLHSSSLSVVRADVFEAGGIAAAVADSEVLLSGLGMGSSDPGDTLVRGAHAAVASGVARIVWLGALGTGASRRVAGPVLGPLLALILAKEIPSKVAADGHIVDAGHTVVHAGRLTDKAATGRFVLVAAADAGRLLLPPSIPRADVAALMLAEAESPRSISQTVVAIRT